MLSLQLSPPSPAGLPPTFTQIEVTSVNHGKWQNPGQLSTDTLSKPSQLQVNDTLEQIRTVQNIGWYKPWVRYIQVDGYKY